MKIKSCGANLQLVRVAAASYASRHDATFGRIITKSANNFIFGWAQRMVMNEGFLRSVNANFFVGRE